MIDARAVSDKSSLKEENNTGSAIEVKGLFKSFKRSFYQKDKLVLNNVHFHIPKCKTTGFVGNNGSGKTTSIKCLLEFIFKDSGEVRFFNEFLNM